MVNSPAGTSLSSCPALLRIFAARAPPAAGAATPGPQRRPRHRPRRLRGRGRLSLRRLASYRLAQRDLEALGQAGPRRHRDAVGHVARLAQLDDVRRRRQLQGLAGGAARRAIDVQLSVGGTGPHRHLAEIGSSVNSATARSPGATSSSRRAGS